MKRLSWILVLLLLCFCKGAETPVEPSDEPSEEPNPVSPSSDPVTGKQDEALAYIFDPQVIPEVHLTITESEWNRVLEAFDKDVDTKEYIHCDALYVKGEESTSIKDAGLRLRGNSTRRRPEGKKGEKHQVINPDWHRAHFGLNFRKFVKDKQHKVHGMQKIVLRAFIQDPAYCREMYSYDLFRRYGVWTALNDVYCRLFLKVGADAKETYFGVYQILEPVDDHFIERREGAFKFYGGDVNGNLWKCQWGATLREVEDDFNNDTDTKNHPYTLKTNNSAFAAAREQLQDFIRKVNVTEDEEFLAWIETVTDVQLLLRTIAVSVAVGSWDDYWNNHNNFYLYFDRAGNEGYQFFYIPYDFDLTLGTSGDTYYQKDAGTKDPLKWGTVTNPLIYRILKKPQWRDYYVACLKELCDPANDYLHYDRSISRILSWHSMIGPYIDNDTGEGCIIRDVPADFGMTPFYRLLDTDPSVNFFRVKASVINEL